MTNQYVPDLSQLGAGDIARSSDVNDRYENTVAGFDRLPAPKVGEQGFADPVPVGTPVNADHAVTKNWAETAMTSQLSLAEGYKNDAQTAASNASTSESNALTSANNASSSAGTATTQANTATTKAGEAATSASNALSSENSASTDAATATTQAGIATTKAGEASSSASAAQSAETNAVAAYDSFDDRYLGPKASDPTLDNDGDALLTGALYFDTNNNDMKVYNGSSWVVAYVPPENLTLQQITDNGATTTTGVTFSGSLTASNASVNLTGIGTTTSTTDSFMTLTAAGLVEKRTLGTNAFSSATFDNYQGWQLNGGSSTETIGKNETVTLSGGGGTTVSNSGNTVTITSTDTNTTNFNIQANSGTAENISAGETINFTGSGGVSVSRTGNSFTIDGSSAGITDVVSDTTPQLGGQLDANGNTILMGVNTITDAKVGEWDTAYGDKVNTVGFDTATGVLTLNRQDGGTVTKDLDGRYPTNDGTGATGSWAINVTGSSGSCTGNAATATTATDCSRSVTGNNGLTGGGALTGNQTIGIDTTGTIGAGTYGSVANGTKIDQITVDAYGRVTAISTGDTGTATTNDTGTPAILSNGTTPSLNAGITAAEVRSLIGAGTSSATPAILSDGTNASLNTNMTGTALRTLIGAGTSSTTGTVTSVAGSNGISGTVTTTGSLSLDSDLRGHAWQIGRDNNDYFIVNTTTHSWFLDAAEDMRLTNAGDLHVEGNITAYSTTVSDARLKDNVETIQNGLEKVCALRGVSYDWNAGSRKGQRDIGVIAQEVQQVVPEVVREVKDSLFEGGDYLSVGYDQLVPVLIEAIKELKAEIDALKGGQ